MTAPLTDDERRLLELIERHTTEHNGQLFIDASRLAIDMGYDPDVAVPRIMDILGKLCRERGLGYSIMEAGGLKPS